MTPDANGTTPAGGVAAGGVAVAGGSDPTAPASARADGRRTAPLGFVVQAVDGARRAVLPMAAVAFGSRSYDAGLPAALTIGAVIVALNGLFGWLAWRRTRYFLGAEDIRVESGIFSRQARSVPYARIQDVAIEQGAVARALGLAKVGFDTGAGGKDELAIAFLTLPQAEGMRETVRVRRADGDTDGVVADAAADIDAGTGAGADPAGPAPRAHTPLYAIGPRRLVLFGLFEFSLIAFAAILGLAQQFDFLLPFDVRDPDDWRRLAGSGAWITGIGLVAQAAGIALAAGAVLLVGIVTGLARTALRDWNFRLDLTSRGFRRRRGLLTRTDVVMPVHRVQAMAVASGWLRRLLGGHALTFVSLAQDAGSTSHTVAPFATMAEVERIVGAAGFALPGPGTHWHRPVARAFRDRALARIAPLVLGAAGLVAWGEGRWAAVPLVLATGAALRQALAWRRIAHAAGDGWVYARHGLLSRTLDLAPQVKLQSVEIAQGPLGRMGGYATLHFGLAGGTLAFDAVPLAQAHRIRADVLDTIAARDFSELV